MAKVVIVVGLPGSGKSHWVDRNRAGFTGLVAYDYFKDSIVPTFRLSGSRHYQDLIESLQSGRDCLVADIAFCDTWRRVEAVQDLAKVVPTALVEWVFFENNPESCRANINRDGGELARDRLRHLDMFTGNYSIPSGVEPLRVWQQPSARSVEGTKLGH